MWHEISIAPGAEQTLRRIRAYDRVAVLEAIERHLRFEPTKTSRSRVKALRGVRRPQFRLRIGDLRVFCDVSAGHVEVLAVVPKIEVPEWLARWGIPIEEEGPPK